MSLDGFGNMRARMMDSIRIGGGKVQKERREVSMCEFVNGVCRVDRAEVERNHLCAQLAKYILGDRAMHI